MKHITKLLLVVLLFLTSCQEDGTWLNESMSEEDYDPNPSTSRIISHFNEMIHHSESDFDDMNQIPMVMKYIDTVKVYVQGSGVKDRHRNIVNNVINDFNVHSEGSEFYAIIVSDSLIANNYVFFGDPRDWVDLWSAYPDSITDTEIFKSTNGGLSETVFNGEEEIQFSRWFVNTNNTYTDKEYWVSLHEFGHSIGFGFHTTTPSTIMADGYLSYFNDFLHPLDKSVLKLLYSDELPPGTTKSETSIILPTLLN